MLSGKRQAIDSVLIKANCCNGQYDHLSQAIARNLVRYESRLEFSQEGRRFFDLVRWGIADTHLNAYLQTEKTRGVGSVSASAAFVKGKNEYFPIPQ